MAHLAEQLAAHVSRSVTYRRGSRTVTLLATVGRSMVSIQEDGNLRREYTDRDYLIDAALLILNGMAVEPRVGDRIIDTNDEATHVYEVLASDGETAWRWSDPFRIKYRVHTKRVS